MKEIILRSVTIHPSKWNDFIKAVTQSDAKIVNSFLTVYNVYQDKVTISFACGFTLEFSSLSKLKEFSDCGFLLEIHR